MTETLDQDRLGTALDFDQLCADYRSGLATKLRGFGPSADYLELWVPDEDPMRSVANMLDAAAELGRPELTLRMGAATTASMDLAELEQAAREFGRVRLVRLEDGVVLAVDALRAPRRSVPQRPRERAATRTALHGAPETAQARPAHVGRRLGMGDVYAKAIGEGLSRIGFERAPKESTGSLTVRGEVGSVALWLVVDTRAQVVRDACFSGTRNALERALLDRLCALCLGLPLQEASDHGVIRLEHTLRDRAQPPPVPGIVTPQAADPAFALPLELLRLAAARYREQTGNHEVANFHDRLPGAGWLAMSEPERLASLRRSITRNAGPLGYHPERIEVLAIQLDVRVVLRMSRLIAEHEKPGLAMRIERAIRDEIDPRLEVLLAELKDRNKLRRLALLQEAP
ncbi:MAG: hypothetical protein MJD61_07945 [Proteobacteria bacterium]|nr:hypothetical protein [Pseudomonadota bacterium]